MNIDELCELEEEERESRFKDFLQNEITSFHLGESLNELDVNQLAKIYNELRSFEPDKDLVFDMLEKHFDNFAEHKFLMQEGMD